MTESTSSSPSAQPEGSAADKPYPANPDEARQLKKQGVRWTNVEIREYYLRVNGGISEQDEKWQQQGLSAEERAHRAYEIRHNARITCREMMESEEEVAMLRARDQEKYGNPDGPTFVQLVEKARKDGLRGDDVYLSIIGSSQRTDEKTNQKLGVSSQPKK